MIKIIKGLIAKCKVWATKRNTGINLMAVPKGYRPVLTSRQAKELYMELFDIYLTERFRQKDVFIETIFKNCLKCPSTQLRQKGSPEIELYLTLIDSEYDRQKLLATTVIIMQMIRYDSKRDNYYCTNEKLAYTYQKLRLKDSAL